MSTNFSNDAATGYVSADGFAGVQSGNPNSPTYAAATFPSGLTIPAGTALPTNTALPALVKITPQVLAAAGASQGNAAAITSSYVRVTVTASTEGVKFPTLVTNTYFNVTVPGTVGVKLYPPTGAQIDSNSTNSSVLLVAGKGSIFWVQNSKKIITAVKGA